MSSQVFSSSKDGGSNTSLPNRFHCLTTLTLNKGCLLFQGNGTSLQLSPFSLALPVGTHEKSLAPPSSFPPIRDIHTVMTSPLRGLASWLKNLPALSASPHTKDAPVPSESRGPCARLAPLRPCPSSTGEPSTGHRTPHGASPALNRAQEHLPRPAGNALPNAALETLGLL